MATKSFHLRNLDDVHGVAQLLTFETNDLLTRLAKQMVVLLENSGIYRTCKYIIDDFIDPVLRQVLSICFEESINTKVNACDIEIDLRSILLQIIRMIIYVMISFLIRKLFNLDNYASGSAPVMTVSSV